jgi:hypothetical protein
MELAEAEPDSLKQSVGDDRELGLLGLDCLGTVT